jgi:hypothetical protein
MTPRDIQNTRTQRATTTADIARRIARARLAQRLATLETFRQLAEKLASRERVAGGPDAHRIPACDLAAIRAEIARTRAAMRALASS